MENVKLRNELEKKNSIEMNSNNKLISDLEESRS